MSKQVYTDALKQAKENYQDLQERGNEALGESWEDVQRELFSPAEISESRLRVDLMGELIKARHEQGVSQKRLEEMSGVKQPVIARMEKGTTSPQLSTFLKVLAPLGKTLAVVPLEN